MLWKTCNITWEVHEECKVKSIDCVHSVSNGSCPSHCCHWSASHRIAPRDSAELPFQQATKKHNLSFKRSVSIKPPGKICLSALWNCLGWGFLFYFVFLNLTIVLQFCLWDVHGIGKWHLQCRKKPVMLGGVISNCGKVLRSGSANLMWWRFPRLVLHHKRK